jgi:protein TonB
MAQPSALAVPQIALPNAPGSLPDTGPIVRHASPLAAPDPLSAPRPDIASPTPPARTDHAAVTSPRPAARPAQPPRAAAPSTPQPARIAQGAGGGATQGAAQASAATASISNAQRQSLMSGWGAQIMARIERARPRVRGSGQVTLTLQIARGGQLAALSVSQSSGDAALDEAAISAVRRAGRFPAAPDGLTDASYGFSLPIRFR